MTQHTAPDTDLATLRRDVALGNRIVHRTGLVSAFGHVSGRIPGTETFFFPTRASPALANPERLLVIDTEGNILAGEGTPNTEFWIHARIYAARPDVGSVVHVHPPACVALCQLGETIRVLHNSGTVFGDGVPVFERAGLIRSRDLGDQVAATLGAGRAMLLRGHGANVADASVRRSVVVACFIEEAADLQLRALAGAGGVAARIRAFDQEETARVRSQIDTPGPMDRAWEYYSALASGEL